MEERHAVENRGLGCRLDGGVSLSGQDGREEERNVRFFVGDQHPRRARGPSLLKTARQFGQDATQLALERRTKASQCLSRGADGPGLDVAPEGGEPMGADLRGAAPQRLSRLLRRRRVTRLNRLNQLLHTDRRVPTEEIDDGAGQIDAVALSGDTKFREHLRLKGRFPSHFGRT